MSAHETDPVLQRLAALRATGLLDSPNERRFDRLTKLTATALRVPISTVTLIDANRQFYKSQIGLPPDLAKRRETPLSHSICRHVVEGGAPLVVADLRTHEVLAENPAVNELGIAAYLGLPISDRDGVVIGSLCAIDTHPRQWSEADLDVLADVAIMVEREIAETTDAAMMAELATVSQSILNTIPHMIWAALPDGQPDGFNDRWHRFTGGTATDAAVTGAGAVTDGEPAWLAYCHPCDRPVAAAAWEEALGEGTPFEAEFRLQHHDGSHRWVLARAEPLRGPDGEIERWFGSCTDIQTLRDLQDANARMKQELAGTLVARLSDRAAYAKPAEFEEIRSLIRDLRTLAGGRV
jgi:PAS domain S-box-containing protein